jgi:hypothetical protein
LECLQLFRLKRRRDVFSLSSGRSFPLPFSTGDPALIKVLRNENIVHEKRSPLLFMKKKRSGNRRTPVEEGDWKIPQGVSLRKLEISSTAGLPS